MRQAVREKGTSYTEFGLGNPDLTDEQRLDAMMAHPILINRPFVVTPEGVHLPSQKSPSINIGDAVRIWRPILRQRSSPPAKRLICAPTCSAS